MSLYNTTLSLLVFFFFEKKMGITAVIFIYIKVVQRQLSM